MSGPVSYSEAVLSAMGAALIAELISGSTIANPVYEAVDGSNNVLWHVDLHATTPLVYGSGGAMTYKRPGTDIFLGYAPVGENTGDTTGFRVRGRDNTIKISGNAGVTGSNNPLELANVSVVNGEAILPFSGEPTHLIQ